MLRRLPVDHSRLGELVASQPRLMMNGLSAWKPLVAIGKSLEG